MDALTNKMPAMGGRGRPHARLCRNVFEGNFCSFPDAWIAVLGPLSIDLFRHSIVCVFEEEKKPNLSPIFWLERRAGKLRYSLRIGNCDGAENSKVLNDKCFVKSKGNEVSAFVKREGEREKMAELSLDPPK